MESFTLAELRLMPNLGRRGSTEASYRSIGTNISKALDLVDAFASAAKKQQIPIFVLLAVANRESHFANVKGADGHGIGIMQIDDRYHPFAKSDEAWECEQNVLYGAGLLKNYYREVSKKFPTWSALWRLRGALVAYNSGLKNVQSKAAIDQGTTGNDYSGDVLAQSKWLWGLRNIFVNLEEISPILKVPHAPDEVQLPCLPKGDALYAVGDLVWDIKEQQWLECTDVGQ